jgi:hypothetical protein
MCSNEDVLISTHVKNFGIEDLATPKLDPFLGYLKYSMDKSLTSASITLSSGCSLFADQMHRLNFFLSHGFGHHAQTISRGFFFWVS